MRTPTRNVRVDDELWARAAAAAEARGSDLSSEIRAFLERLARSHERKVGK
jgi:antitoxin component of RelBE/YafQ-DinJ toxin-antitoxin module